MHLACLCKVYVKNSNTFYPYLLQIHGAKVHSLKQHLFTHFSTSFTWTLFHCFRWHCGLQLSFAKTSQLPSLQKQASPSPQLHVFNNLWTYHLNHSMNGISSPHYICFSMCMWFCKQWLIILYLSNYGFVANDNILPLGITSLRQ